MKQHFIFQYTDTTSLADKVVTVIFISQLNFDQNRLSQEINEFYREHSFADKIVVLIPSFISEECKEMFLSNRTKTFERVPGKSNDYFDECLTILQYDSIGNFNLIFGKELADKKMFVQLMLRAGSTIIFKNHGGLVESTPDHHFVFPSKKHCDKFIRTANILINSYEVFFIAIQLLKHFENKKEIYCDTASISSLAYAVFELKRRFNESFNCPTVNSFNSYTIFESNTVRFSNDALLLVSSSTSGNIIERLITQDIIEKEQIIVLYFLGSKESYNNHSTNILCNLSYELSKFTIGIEPFQTYDSEYSCKLCQKHSIPIHIQSDVFLTIQPRINSILLSADDAPKWVSSFVNSHRATNGKDTVIRTYYKEDDANADYEIFINTEDIYSRISDYNEHNNKLNRLINKYIPANTGCIIHLDDNGSKILAKLIKDRSGIRTDTPIICMKKGFEEHILPDTKCVIIVASSIVMGKEFLHVSRILRKFTEMGIIYFVGYSRTIRDEYLKTLKSNLTKGQPTKGESDNRPLHLVESITTSAKKTNTSWYQEQNLWKTIFSDLDDEDSAFGKYINSRLDLLRLNKESTGLSTEVFLPKYDGTPLVLRKNFAFFNFSYKESEIAQSELYFTISCILNQLSNNKLTDKKTLAQSKYLRNIIDPSNFIRFNDGIIQACLLRAGKPEYFAYDLDKKYSSEMKMFLLTVIKQYDNAHGEALLEFLFAIGINKLRLQKEDTIEVLNSAKACPNEIISALASNIIELKNK